MKLYIITDWIGNLPFGSKTFPTLDDAYEFLTLYIEETYPDTENNDERFSEEIGEYYIEEYSN